VLRVELCGASVLGEAMVLMRTTVLEMIFVGARVLRATVLGEATVIGEASVIVGATVLEASVLIGATVLKATVPWKARSMNSLGPRCHGDFSCEVVGATVLGATVHAGASEVCVTPGHEVGRHQQQRRELSVLYTTL
jgi:hypothetical protein